MMQALLFQVTVQCNFNKVPIAFIMNYISFLFWSQLITARIRSMTGRYCFHRCLSVNILGGVPGLRFSGGGQGGYLVSDFQGGEAGGVPGLRFFGGGTWSQIFWGGTWSQIFWGGTWSQIFWGGRGVPGLRFLGGGGGYLVSDFFGGWGGYLVSDFQGEYLVSDFLGGRGVPGLRFFWGGVPGLSKGKKF